MCTSFNSTLKLMTILFKFAVVISDLKSWSQNRHCMQSTVWTYWHMYGVLPKDGQIEAETCSKGQR